MSNLLDRIRKARQTRVVHAGKTFVVRRPTDWEAYEMRSGAVKELDLLEKFVDGWENFTELDLVPGGSNESVEFDRALFVEWIQDQADFWAPIIGAITAEYQAHALRQAEAEKIAAWLEEFKQPFPPGAPPEDAVPAIHIWIMMDRCIDYTALPVLAEIYNILDVETLLIQLVAIRDHKWPNQSR